MTEGIRNPVNLQSLLPLLPAEEEFARRLGEGKPCQVGNGKLPKPEERIESGDAANVVRPEVIRFFVCGGNSDRPVRGSFVALMGAWIPDDGELDLTHAEIPHALIFSNCHFAVAATMPHMACRALTLNGSRLARGLMADGLKVKGSLFLCDGFSAEGEVRLFGASIDKDFSCQGGKFHNPGGDALAADGMTTRGGVLLGRGFSAEGRVRLLCADIDKLLNCAGGEFCNPGGDALLAAGMTTRGDVFLDGVSAKGKVDLFGAKIGGQFSCAGGKFVDSGPTGCALVANEITTGGDVRLVRGFSANGEVQMLGAKIGGQFSCAGGKFVSPDSSRCALNADRITTGGDAVLGGGFSAEGEVRLLGANIGRALFCVGGKFCNPSGNAIAADGITAKGGVYLNDGFSAEGAVRLPGANVGANFSCENGRFVNSDPEGCALFADRITTEGSMLLTGDFSSEVRLPSAKIGGDLECVGRLNNPAGMALNAQNAKVVGGLLWCMSGNGVVDLGHAKAGVLVDVSDSWNSFKVNLVGFDYGQFYDPVGVKFRAAWLGNRPADMPFSPLPYEQAAKVLRAMGKDIDAWDIEREKRRLERAERDSNNAPKVPLLQRLWGRTIDALTDFVYRPWKTLGWAAPIVLAGALLFHFADENGRMVPHQPVVLANAEYKSEMARATGNGGQCRDGPKPTEAVARVFPDYPEFNAAVYSLDVFIPFFALHQEPYWYPKPREMDGWFLRRVLPFWYWLEIGFGWILTSLFLLSVTGVLRPRQSSGEKG